MRPASREAQDPRARRRARERPAWTEARAFLVRLDRRGRKVNAASPGRRETRVRQARQERPAWTEARAFRSGWTGGAAGRTRRAGRRENVVGKAKKAIVAKLARREREAKAARRRKPAKKARPAWPGYRGRKVRLVRRGG